MLLFMAMTLSAATTTPQAGVPSPVPAPTAITRTSYVAKIDLGFRTLDTNKDGYLSDAELKAATDKQNAERQAQSDTQRRQLFAKLDINKDGQLSQAEFMAGVKTAAPLSATPAAIIGKLDTNKDGKIGIDEYRAPNIGLFDRLDRNHDGILSEDERKQAGAAK